MEPVRKTMTVHLSKTERSLVSDRVRLRTNEMQALRFITCVVGAEYR